MVSSESFYPGADYGLDPDYGSLTGYRIRAADLGYPTDPITANQLQKVSQKLNTGAKTIEVSGLGLASQGISHMDKIPKQHWEEINRLRKLTGVNLTFHGPLIEPSGLNRQGNWSETERQHAETEFTSAIERAQKIDPKGNLVVTIHASNGLPEPRTEMIDENGKKKTVGLAVVNKRTGQIGQIPVPEYDYITDQKPSYDQFLKDLNERNWTTTLSNISIGAHRSQDVLNTLSASGKDSGKSPLQILKDAREIPDIQEADLEKARKAGFREPSKILEEWNFAEANVKDSYIRLQQAFNEAYRYAKDNNISGDLQKLEAYRNEIKDKVPIWKKDPEKLGEFADALTKGTKILGSLSEIPQDYEPLEKFAIDKASDTFSGVAFNAYKKFGKHSPIISIENPPVGLGLSKADELKKLVNESRKKFVDRAVNDMHMSRSQAEKEAEKLIGITWDVGHINMLRKFGYKDKDLVKQTKTIAPYVKHVHLSDNFGLEHTELPMGMGNVPTKEHLKAIEKYNKQAKKIVETGDWFSKQGGLGIEYTPVRESLRAFGSPVYPMQMAPYWSQAANNYGGQYFLGLGEINPSIHHSTFGSGFSNLPAELGAQIPGTNRLSGTPD